MHVRTRMDRGDLCGPFGGQGTQGGAGKVQKEVEIGAFESRVQGTQRERNCPEGGGQSIARGRDRETWDQGQEGDKIVSLGGEAPKKKTREKVRHRSCAGGGKRGDLTLGGKLK